MHGDFINLEVEAASGIPSRSHGMTYGQNVNQFYKHTEFWYIVNFVYDKNLNKLTNQLTNKLTVLYFIIWSARE